MLRLTRRERWETEEAGDEEEGKGTMRPIPVRWRQDGLAFILLGGMTAVSMLTTFLFGVVILRQQSERSDLQGKRAMAGVNQPPKFLMKHTAPHLKSPAALQDLPPCMNASDIGTLLLISGANVFDPTPRGRMDILVGGGKVLRMLEGGGFDSAELERKGLLRVVDASGLIATPGLVDMHVHLTGGGGEAGPASRVPQPRLSEFIQGGLTTVVGLLGTDSISRSLEALSMTVAGLNLLPISAFMYTGAYK